MEQSNINNSFNISSQKVDVKSIQLSSIEILNKLFIKELMNDFNSEIEGFTGVRGSYEDKPNIVLSFCFNYFIKYRFDIYLYYDQLEYYISKEGKTIKKCNLEDFWEEKIMIEKFITYLKTDLKMLEIPFNK